MDHPEKAAFFSLAGLTGPPPAWQTALIVWANLVTRTPNVTTFNAALLSGLTGLPNTGTPCYAPNGVWNLPSGTPCGIDMSDSPAATAAALSWVAGAAAFAPCAANCCPAGHSAFPTSAVDAACSVVLAFQGAGVAAGDTATHTSWCPEAVGFAWTKWVHWLTDVDGVPAHAVACSFDPCLTTVPDPTGMTQGAAFQCSGGEDPAAAPSFQATLNATALAMNVACSCAGAGVGGPLCGGHGTCAGSGVALTTSGGCSAADVAAGTPVAAYSDPAFGVGTTPCTCFTNGFTGPDCTQGTDCPASCTPDVGTCAGGVCICAPGKGGPGCATDICPTPAGGSEACGGDPCVNGVCACSFGCGVDCSIVCADAVGALAQGARPPLRTADPPLQARPGAPRASLYDVLAATLAAALALIVLLLTWRAVRRAAAPTPQAAGGHVRGGWVE